MWGLGSRVGPHPVGFASETLTRTSSAGVRRTLTLSVWYPAAAPDTGDAVSVSDLFELTLAEGQLDEPVGLSAERGLSAAMTGDPAALAVDRARRVLATPTLARHGAPPAPDAFPLVLWSTRHATTLAQAPMAEVLASRGNVVATVWSSDPPLAFLWEDHPAADKVATIEEHTADLRHALSVLRSGSRIVGRPHATGRVVVLAWSYGGQTAAGLQELEDDIDAVIGLDANVLPSAPEERLDLRRPLIQFVGRDTTNRGLGHLDGLEAPWILVRLPELAHGSFNALEGYLPALYGAEGAFPWAQTDDSAIQGYRALVRMVAAAVAEVAEAASEGPGSMADRLSAAAGPYAIELRGGARR